MRLGEQKTAALACIRSASGAVSMADIRKAHPGVCYAAVEHLLKTEQVRRVFHGWYEDPALPPLENAAEVAVFAIRAAGRPVVMRDLAAYRLRPEQVARLVEQGVLKVHLSGGHANASVYYVAADKKPRRANFIRPRKPGMNTEAIRLLRGAPTVTLDEFVAHGVTLSALMTLVNKGRIRRVGKGVYALAELVRPPTKVDRVVREFEEIGHPMALGDIMERWKISGTCLNRLVAQGRLVWLDKGVYGLPGQTLAQYARKRPESYAEKTLRLLQDAKGPLTAKQLKEQGVDAYTPVRLAALGRIRRLKHGVYCLFENDEKMAA